MDQVHVKSSRSASRSNPTKMACEKASRRLRTILVKASRLGVPTTEVAKLPTAKKLIPQRDHGWKLAVVLLLMFGGGVIVALACTARKGCSKLEEIEVRPNSVRLEVTARRSQGLRPVAGCGRGSRLTGSALSPLANGRVATSSTEPGDLAVATHCSSLANNERSNSSTNAGGSEASKSYSLKHRTQRVSTSD